MDDFVEVPFVGKGMSDENSFSLFKDKAKLTMSIETEDGEASISLTRKHFDTLVEQARVVMGWKA